MLLILVFLCGMGNFAMHRAVVESQHPFVEDTKRYFGRYFGPHGSYLIEFVLLLAAMFLLEPTGGWVALVYAAYTAANGFAAWMLLSGKI